VDHLAFGPCLSKLKTGIPIYRTCVGCKWHLGATARRSQDDRPAAEECRHSLARGRSGVAMIDGRACAARSSPEDVRDAVCGRDPDGTPVLDLAESPGVGAVTPVRDASLLECCGSVPYRNDPHEPARARVSPMRVIDETNDPRTVTGAVPVTPLGREPLGVPPPGSRSVVPGSLLV
jgi:hypothetical protein